MSERARTSSETAVGKRTLRGVRAQPSSLDRARAKGVCARARATRLVNSNSSDLSVLEAAEGRRRRAERHEIEVLPEMLYGQERYPRRRR